MPFMLKVSYRDQSMPVMCRQQFALNDNSSVTGSLLTKLHRNVGAQWLSGRVLDSTEGPWVKASSASLCCGP